MKLQVLTYQREDKWFAIGLEHGVYAQAATLPAVISGFLDALALQIIFDQGEGYEALSDMPPAPEEFWERYRQSPFHLTIDLPIPTEAQDFVPEIRVAA